MTGRFGQSDVAGNLGLEDLGAEDLSDLVTDISAQSRASVDHGEQDTFHLK